MSRLRHVVVATMTTAALVLAACGGESEEEAVVKALTTELMADETFVDHGIDEDEARCAAQSMVDELGADRMVEIGFNDEDPASGSDDEPPAGAEADFSDLSEDEIGVLADAMETCIDDMRQLMVASVSEGILEDPDPNFPIDGDEADCVADRMVDGIELQRLIVIGLQSEGSGTEQFAALDQGETDMFTAAFTGCIDVRQILLDGIAANGVSDEVLDCLDANISDDDIDALFTAGFSGQDTDTAAERILAPAIRACL